MYGHIVLLNIIGCLVADVEPPNTEQDETEPKEISPLEDPMLESIGLSPIALTYDILAEYFINEKNVIFNTLERIYGIDEQTSSSSSWKRDGENEAKRRKQILALNYGAMLAFCIAVDFKICTLIFSIFEDNNNEGYENLKQNCHSYFDEMYFVFREFQKVLHGIIFRTEMEKQLGKYLLQDETETKVVHWVLTLSLDFILDKNSLDKQKLSDRISGSILWWATPDVLIDGKYYKTYFPFADFVLRSYRIENETIEEMYAKLYKVVKSGMNLNIRRSTFLYLSDQVLQDPDYYNTIWFWEIFSKIKYPTRLHMWRLLMEEFPVDSQAESVHRISKAIKVMRKIRLMHYTILFRSIKEYEEELLGLDLAQDAGN